MNRALIRSFFIMVKSNKCSIDDIPEKYREEVRAYEEQLPMKAAQNNNMKSKKVIGDIDPIRIFINKNKISEFTIPLKKYINNNLPEDYYVLSLERVENVYNAYETVNASINDEKELIVSGIVNNSHQGNHILRIDVMVKGLKYNSKSITFYIDIE